MNINYFEHNLEFYDIKKYLKKIEKLKATVEIEDYYMVKLNLPEDEKEQRELFIFILTSNNPLPSGCILNKKKNILTLEWHF